MGLRMERLSRTGNPLVGQRPSGQGSAMDHTQSLIALPYYSGAGHTAQVARAIATGATESGARAVPVNVEDMSPDDWNSLDRADAILFGAPTYMGSAAARYGAFLEEAGERWMDLGWKDKLAGGFTVATFPSGDKLATLQRFSIFAAQMGMIWVGPADIGAPVFPEREGVNADGGWLGLMATSAHSPRGAVREGDLETAAQFGARVAGIAQRLRGSGS
ncbi:flavodoxin family protein [Tateyamaria sp. Alg231-49]|uniref:flavodoxin family protein n=1 Tax=Tateyamaria sp. Alg231-49 TaxID=1922219 RepID=UPI001F40C77B|nr:flavodoxin family protein [Tateyamaria sp. Alg231-49]